METKQLAANGKQAAYKMISVSPAVWKHVSIQSAMDEITIKEFVEDAIAQKLKSEA